LIRVFGNGLRRAVAVAVRFALGRIHRTVGVRQQAVRVASVCREAGDADAGVEPEQAVGQGEGWVEAGAKAIGDGLGGRSIVTAGQQRDKLVAADASHQIPIPKALLQTLCDSAQQAVAGIVSGPVVDLLEAVEIQVEHGQAAAGLRCVRDGVLQLALQPVAIGQSGQGVVAGAVFEFTLPSPD